MKRHVLALAMSFSVSACVAAPTPGTTAPTTSVAPSVPPATTVAVTASPTGSARPVAYRVIPSVPGRATVSPDGRWIAAVKSPAGASIFDSIQLFTIDGTPTREITDAGVFWGWLSDSSGLFVAPTIPQRAPPLAVVNLDGRVIATELQLSHQMLSRDAALIVAEHQEGCCVAIIQREIRVARRDGSGTRTLALSASTAEPSSVSLLGVDAQDRAVYRDGTQIRRIPLGGGAASALGTSPDYERLLSGSTSPDGLAILTAAIRDGRSYVIANDRVSLWDDALGLIVEESTPPSSSKSGGGHVWVGPHSFLVRDPSSGSLSTVDAVTTTRTPNSGQLIGGDLVLAHQRDTLLVVRDRIVVVLIDLRTGAVRDTGLELATGGGSPSGAALPGGGFVLSSGTSTYRID